MPDSALAVSLNFYNDNGADCENEMVQIDCALFYKSAFSFPGTVLL